MVYSPDDYMKYEGQAMLITDTFCVSETARAERDINAGKLKLWKPYLYTDKYYFRTKQDVFEKYLQTELSKYNIALDTTWYAPGIDEGTQFDAYFDAYCYPYSMFEEIRARQGNRFADSLVQVIERKYVVNFPEQIYEAHDCDTVSKNKSLKTYSMQREELKQELALQFVYPDGYSPKNETSFSYTTVHLILKKDGTISSSTAEASFQNPDNEKYRKYFETYVLSIAQKYQWTPITLFGMPVNCKIAITMMHK